MLHEPGLKEVDIVLERQRSLVLQPGGARIIGRRAASCAGSPLSALRGNVLLLVQHERPAPNTLEVQRRRRFAGTPHICHGEEVQDIRVENL